MSNNCCEEIFIDFFRMAPVLSICTGMQRFVPVRTGLQQSPPVPMSSYFFAPSFFAYIQNNLAFLFFSVRITGKLSDQPWQCRFVDAWIKSHSSNHRYNLLLILREFGQQHFTPRSMTFNTLPIHLTKEPPHHQNKAKKKICDSTCTVATAGQFQIFPRPSEAQKSNLEIVKGY